MTTIANSTSNIITLTLVVSKKLVAFKISDLFIINTIAVIINVTNPYKNQIIPHFLLEDCTEFLPLKKLLLSTFPKPLAIIAIGINKSNILFIFLLECLLYNPPIQIIITGTIMLQNKINIFI